VEFFVPNAPSPEEAEEVWKRRRLLPVLALALTTAILVSGPASATVSLRTGTAKAHASRALAEKHGASWTEAGKATKRLTVKRRQSASKIRFSYLLATTVEKEGTCPGPDASLSECTPAEAQQATYAGVVIVWRPASDPGEIRTLVVQKSDEIGACSTAC
jgi:hypothetical protein